MGVRTGLFLALILMSVVSCGRTEPLACAPCVCKVPEPKMPDCENLGYVSVNDANRLINLTNSLIGLTNMCLNESYEPIDYYIP